MSNLVVITGCDGQIGYFLSKFYLEKGFNVVGCYKSKIKKEICHKNFVGRQIDITNENEVLDLILLKPFLFINCAAISKIKSSFLELEKYIRTNTFSVTNQINLIQRLSKGTKYINLGSEKEGLNTPYGVSKMLCRPYIQEALKGGIWAIQPYLCNVESSCRSEGFLTHKIITGAKKIQKSLVSGKPFESIKIGNMSIKKDFLHIDDFCEQIYEISLLEKPLNEPVNICSGERREIAEFVDITFEKLGIDGIFVFDKPNNWEQVYYAQKSFEEIKLVEVEKAFYEEDDIKSIKIIPFKKPRYSFEQLISKLIYEIE